METTLAFVLGMSVVVVIVLAVVAVIGFVKAIKTEKALNEHIRSLSIELDIKDKKLEETRKEILITLNNFERDIHMRIDDVIREDEKKFEDAHRRMDEIMSQMDSRFDKTYDANKSNVRSLENYMESLIKDLNTKINNNKNLIND